MRPRFCNSATVFRARSTSRSQIATTAPDSRNRSTMARPIPCAPPVTTALRLVRSILLVMAVSPTTISGARAPWRVTKMRVCNAQPCPARRCAVNLKMWGRRRSPRFPKACEPKHRLLRTRRGPMLSPSYSISPKDLWNAIATRDSPQLVDVRRRDAYQQSPHLLPGAHWRDAANVASWMVDFDPARPLVVACKAGHEMSQSAVAQLRADGIDARILEGGYEGWERADLPMIAKAELERLAPKSPSVWVTRRRPKIDRIACPWLIRRFLDPKARILFVDPDQVVSVARETGGVPFDIKDVELSHVGERCSFDTMLGLFGLESEPSLARLALIVRGADTARPDIAAEAAGLHAVSLGLSALAGDDDHGLLRRGFIIYDALFAWLRFAAEERHNWPAKAA